ncbi:dual specificity mitogen-activated protein kinase kinase hemipterous-like [Microplitis mediator]|uniref:dual specificity mitogen-activated protein kinase kinase hemipterous-like n=1 Tax=Microplitis mediator TaxID=375433 RepID=UPI00255702B5|nr:dual specificity mitogen-activated protein kinase kinase hemipterous-like [Microplitis mediator]
MSSTLENKILNLQERLRAETESRDRDRRVSSDVPPGSGIQPSSSAPTSSSVVRRPRQLGDMGTPTRSRKQLDLPIQMVPPKTCDSEVDSKLQEIMKMNGILTINGLKYQTEMKDLEHLGELGNGTCGHVVKMKHKPSGVVIAVKQMRRSGNTEENKRIIMDLDVVLKSHDCPYIVQCLGCFITESDVWICMELMATCLDKLLKKCRQPIPEDFLGKVTVATVKALSYLKESHGVIHRDVKPSNILLDETGGVKLCDFGISGRLVDSKAKTRSAGCAAYMAPERIDPPDPTKPDYDIRADVWSLGITLVELATGVFPYRDCKTDFEVLSRVVQEDPPALPSGTHFSKEFRSFVTCCLTKNYKQRPKYNKLIEHSFIKKYDSQENNADPSLPTSGCQWLGRVMKQLEPRLGENDTQQRVTGHISLKQTANLRNNQSEKQNHLKNNPTTGTVTKEPLNPNSTFSSFYHRLTSAENGISTYVPYSPYTWRRKEITRPFSPPTNKTNEQDSVTTSTLTTTTIGVTTATRSYSPYRQYIEQNRRSTNGSSVCKVDINSLDKSSYHNNRFEERDSSTDRWQSVSRSLSPFARDYSPWRRENVDPPGVIQPITEPNKYSPFVQQRLGQYSTPTQTPPSSLQTHPPSYEIYGSPMISRKRFPSEPPVSGSHGSTSPQLLISRFAHQLKQEPLPKIAPVEVTNPKESAKKRFASYVRLRLGGERAPSPEPPPRFSRGESPLAIRRNLIDQPSPSFSRRYISPSPPQPPPRRLSESNSVPGSPQHVRARLHYTPEPQRRPQLP